MAPYSFPAGFPTSVRTNPSFFLLGSGSSKFLHSRVFQSWHHWHLGWDNSLLVGRGGCPVPWRKFHSNPWPLPTRHQGNPLQVGQREMPPGIIKYPLRGKMPPSEPPSFPTTVFCSCNGVKSASSRTSSLGSCANSRRASASFTWREDAVLWLLYNLVYKH